MTFGFKDAVFLPESIYSDFFDSYYLNKVVNVFLFAFVIWAFLTIGILLVVGLPTVLIFGSIWECYKWFKRRGVRNRAKDDAYYMLESGRIHSQQFFNTVVEELERWRKDREARHLLYHLDELEKRLAQMPDEDENDEEDED